jgi:hypothetical protein
MNHKDHKVHKRIERVGLFEMGYKNLVHSELWNKLQGVFFDFEAIGSEVDE